MRDATPMEVWERIPADQRRVILIDGGAGAGKSTLAAALAKLSGATLVSCDWFYPGWDGLAAGSRMVASDVLRDHRYRRWDWSTNTPGQWVNIDADPGLVVEGCGSLTPETRMLASYGIWLQTDPQLRKNRALARDGSTFAAHWERWARQEREHWKTNTPQLLADLVLLS